jgi:DNA-binding MarR family transcriptional regulator
MAAEYTLTEIVDILTRAMGEMESHALAGSEFAALSMRQLHYLDMIHRLGHPTLSELAQELGVSRPSVTAAVAKLVAAGYLKKVTSDEDRRVAHVHLAPKGRRIVRLHDAVHQSVADLFTRALNRSELNEMIRMLNKVIAHLNATAS